MQMNKNVDVYKGAMLTTVGQSSVLDISLREGNRKTKVNGGIGLISSRLTVEGPIVKDKSSFIISGRRTYLDVLTRPFIATHNWLVRDIILRFKC